MTTLLENPFWIIFIGIVVEAILAGVYVSTRRVVVVVVMVAVLAVILGFLILEWAVVTERERVEATIDGVAAALEANDWDRVRDHCAADARRTRARLDYAQSVIRVTDTSVHNLRIEISRLTSPPMAEARFDGVVAYDGKGFGRGRYPAKFTVKLHLIGDRWLITDHVEYELQGR